MGDGVHFSIEKGGSARADLLSQQPLNPQRKKRKLLDAAATRIGTTVTLLEKNLNEEREKRKREQEEDKYRLESESQQQENGVDNSNGSKESANGKDGSGSSCSSDSNSRNGRKNGLPGTTGMDWLNNNISRKGLDREMERLRRQDREQEDLLKAAVAEENHGLQNQTKIIVLSDYIDPALQCPSLWDENTRKVTFQSLYKKEIGRQNNLLHLPEHNETVGNFSSPPKASFLTGNNSIAVDDRSVAWEDG